MSDFFSLYNLVFMIFPIGSAIIGVLGYLIFKKAYLAPLFILVVFLILTYTVYNGSFLIWAILYTMVALITTLFTRVVGILLFRRY